MTDRKKYNLLYTLLAVLNANLAFLFFDYTLSIFNSLIPFLQDFIFPSASSSVITFIASAPIITAAVAALISGPLATKFGRRKIMILSDFFAILGVILTLFASLPVMIIGRLLIGIQLGVTTVVVPLYFTEIPPPKYIGPFGICLPLLGTLGVLAAFSLGLAVPTELAPGQTTQIWRILMSLSILIVVWRILNFWIFFRTDTPQYLLQQNRVEEAKEALGKVYKVGVDERIEGLIKDRDYVQTKGKVGFLMLFTRKYRRALLMGVILMSVQQLVGFNIVMVHAQEIFGAGITDKNDRLPQYLSIALAGVFHLSSYFLFWSLNKFNRKSLLLFGTVLLGAVEILFGVISKITSPGSIAPKIILVLWPIPFNISLGSIPSILLPETLPDSGVSISFLVNWIWSFLTVQFFPNVADAIGVDGAFLIMGGICFASSIYFWKEVVETKGKTKIEVLQMYNGLREEEPETEEKEEDPKPTEGQVEMIEPVAVKVEPKEITTKSDVEAQTVDA